MKHHFASYWKGTPYIERVRHVSIPDPASSRSAFITGQTSFFGINAPEDRAAMENQQGIATTSWEHVGWEFFRLNQNFGPFTNPDVRKAINLVLDRYTMMIHNYGEGYWDHSGPLVSGFPGAWLADEVAQLPGWREDKDADIADARALMAAAGYDDGEIEFEITPMPAPGHAWNNNAVIGQELLQAVWPDMRATLLGGQDFTEFNRALSGGDYEAITYASFPPPSALVEGCLHYRTGGGRNYTQYTNDEADRLIDAAFIEFDADARNALISELQEVLLDDVFIVPLGKARQSFAYRDYIRNFEGWSGPGSFAAYDPTFSAHQLWIDE